MSERVPLSKGVTGKLDASGAATLEVGPDARGKQNWRITSVLLKSSRPGQAPIPRAEVWVDAQDPNSQQGLTYDGSFASGRCDIPMTRGQVIICQWTGGQTGDTVQMTVNGEAW